MPGLHKIALNGYGRLGLLAMQNYLCSGSDTLPQTSIDGMFSSLRTMPDDDTQTIYTAVRNKDDSITYRRFTSQPQFQPCVDPDYKPDRPRYEGRTFPKDYQKKRKARQRQQKQARRKARK